MGLPVTKGREPAFTKHLQCSLYCTRVFALTLIHLFLPAILGRWCYHPQLLSEDTKMQRGLVTFRSHVVNKRQRENSSPGLADPHHATTTAMVQQGGRELAIRLSSLSSHPLVTCWHLPLAKPNPKPEGKGAHRGNPYRSGSGHVAATGGYLAQGKPVSCPPGFQPQS